MIVYEVNHDVDKEIEKEYVEWLSSHIQQMLGFDGFISVDWYTLADGDDERTAHWSIHYHVKSMSELKAYQETHAQKMIADGASRFGGRYRTSRRILSLFRHLE